MFFTPFLKKDLESVKTGNIKPVDEKSVRRLISNSSISDVYNRAFDYAVRTPLQHCDEPAILLGKVPLKYLKSVNGNSYEVVLGKENVSQIKVKACFALSSFKYKDIIPHKIDITNALNKIEGTRRLRLTFLNYARDNPEIS